MTLDSLQRLRILKELHSLQNRTFDLACIQLEHPNMSVEKLVQASFDEINSTYSNIEKIVRHDD